MAAPAQISTGRRWLWIAAPVLVAVIAVGGYFAIHRTQALTEKDSVLVTEFVNTTGDPVFDGTLKQALAVQLEQSPYLNLLPESKVQEALRLMGRHADERITGDVAREISQREGVKAMMTGSIASLGSHYVITVEAINAQNGDSLAREQVEAESKEQVLKSLDKAATDLRRKLGESLASVQQYTTPLEQATTSSLDALKEFSAGRAQHDKYNDEAAIPHLKRAIELDPNFAIAYAVLGVASSNFGQIGPAVEDLKKAYELRERASEPEKFYITAHYNDLALGEMEKAAETYEQWHKSYPRDTTPPDDLAGGYLSLGLYEKSLGYSSEAMRLDLKDPFPYSMMADAYLSLNRMEEAAAISERAVAQKLDSLPLHAALFSIAFLRGDQAGMQRESEWGAGTDNEPAMLALKAAGESALGKNKTAKETWERAFQSANHHGFSELASTVKARQAVRDATLGYVDLARQEATAALSLRGERSTRCLTALAFAQIGDFAKAQKLVDDLSKEFPSDTYVNFYFRPVVLGLIALPRNNPAEAITAVEPYRKYAMGSGPDIPVYWFFYVRGLAFLRQKDGAKAAAEFQTILDHRGINPTSELYPLAQLNLARAYVVQGDMTKARTAYQDFFAIWKDADPEIPVLQEARAEYAKLK